MKELLEKILGQIKKTPSGVRAYEDLYHICLETQKTDIPLSVEYLKKLSDIIENRIPQSETDKELRSLFMLHKKVLLAAAPFDFESYLLYIEWEREPDKKFYVPRREVMHPVVQAMQDLIDDRLDLLTISMPPGTGKSTLGIFFLSWVNGFLLGVRCRHLYSREHISPQVLAVGDNLIHTVIEGACQHTRVSRSKGL